MHLLFLNLKSANFENLQIRGYRSKYNHNKNKTLSHKIYVKMLSHRHVKVSERREIPIEDHYQNGWIHLVLGILASLIFRFYRRETVKRG